MTQEEKQLLLKDLCARLPYHPKGHVVNACNGAECDEWLTCATFLMFTIATNNCRLYLRPMSSMTEEEKREYKHLIAFSGNPIGSANFIDWLNAHHFDYRTIYDEDKKKYMSMIEKGLAIEVTKENNPYGKKVIA